jgi:leucyl-tRNA synthetase
VPKYNPAVIEPRWQTHWEAHRVFASPKMPGGKKLYVLDMFPYPSGDGLHVGHPEGYTATDIVSRFSRMRGFSVMHPMGFDAFGLPAEEHAIKTNTHPRIQTQKNIATFRRQLKMLGFSYDWDRELATTDTGYVRWTQWIFLQIHDTWFDVQAQRGRPISELPIPPEVRAQGESAIRRFQDTHRLAYQAEAPVNWCPALGTVLANEEVIDGKSERGGHPVERRPMRQWMMRITAYADRLEKDLEGLEWSEGIKQLQRNWIGRSVGAEVEFKVSAPTGDAPPREQDSLRVFTTRPDTLFGATYMVVAPEHPLVTKITLPEHKEAVDNYCKQAARKSDRERAEIAKDKTGVFTGAFAINPVNLARIPIWIADYVLSGYGTGAIMAVPAHDERDFEFAKKFDLEIVPVVDPGNVGGVDRDRVLAGDRCFAGDGLAINSGRFNGKTTADVKREIIRDLQERGLGHEAVNYKLRDWLFSRQRFWGEPFPILHELDDSGNPTGLHLAVPDSLLPVDLPELDDFRPHGRPDPLLEKAPAEWLFPVIEGKRYKRETNTMPQWAGSCWYYLRFLDPKNEQRLLDPAIEKAWLPVDLYVGGAEHAVLHLLYARFWHKVLYDRGVVSAKEPFTKLVNQGMILGEIEITGYQDSGGGWVSAADVMTSHEEGYIHRKTREPVSAVSVKPADSEKTGDLLVLKGNPDIRLDSRAYKMSKARGNVVNPDHIIREFGADSLRLYEMFMGPLEATKPWSTDGVSGVRGFLGRAWRMIIDEHAEEMQLHPGVQDTPLTDEQQRIVHRTIAAVTKDTETMGFNTAIARMMEFVNFFTKEAMRPRAAMEPFVLILAPYAPHIAEELWEALGHKESLAYSTWPTYEDKWLVDPTVEIPVQIQGKVRGKIVVPTGITKEDLQAAAIADPKVAEHLHGQTIIKTVIVPGKLINFVVGR